MSAYAALKDNSSIGSAFHEGPDCDDDDDIIQYQQNSSDDESNENGKTRIPTTNLKRPSYSLESSKQSTPSSFILVSNHVTHSRFTPSNANIISQENYVLVGLKGNEFIVINGQCTLSILRGSILLNNHHYLCDQSTVHNILAPVSQALPIVSCTPILYGSTQNEVEGNESHLFSSEFSSVIKLSSLRTGLENIGTYYAPFKNIFFSNDDSISPTDLDRYEKLFRNYSFEIVLKDKGMIGLNIDNQWSLEIKDLTRSLANCSIPKIIMVIGNKNTGKSTFSKTLLNSFLLQNQGTKLSYLDIDPGQAEFSAPYSLTLAEELATTFGMNIPSRKVTNNERISHYFGFTTPIHQPDQYIALIQTFFNHYIQFHKPKGNHLIINTPGWIKGYGKEILMEITSLINPDYLVLLSNSLNLSSPENSEVLNDLKFQQSIICPGIYQTSKYSASQLRLFNKLLYFHQKDILKFDFQKQILDNSPLKLSYQTRTDTDDFVGINVLSILNFEVEKSFAFEDVFLMIDSTIMGIYLIHEDIFKGFKPFIQKLLYSSENYPLYLRSEILERTFSITNQSAIKFTGLCMIHSINKQQSYFNLYLPEDNKNEISSLLLRGFKLVLVKGEGEIPSPEILSEELISEHELFMNRLKGGSGEANYDKKRKLPYISFQNQKIGGVWKVRRNILRRSHRR